MAQVKIYGRATFIQGRQGLISDAIHEASKASLGLPDGKRFHRFFPLSEDDFIHPEDRSGAYLILEIHLFQGRSPEKLRDYIRHLQKSLETVLKVSAHDIEITLLETPASHWGIRGQLGNELQLTYEVNL